MGWSLSIGALNGVEKWEIEHFDITKFPKKLARYARDYLFISYRPWWCPRSTGLLKGTNSKCYTEVLHSIYYDQKLHCTNIIFWREMNCWLCNKNQVVDSFLASILYHKGNFYTPSYIAYYRDSILYGITTVPQCTIYVRFTFVLLSYL